MAALNAVHAAFQFHKGTIRTPLLVAFTLDNSHFNSIKVRLEQLNKAVGGVQNSISIP